VSLRNGSLSHHCASIVQFEPDTYDPFVLKDLTQWPSDRQIQRIQSHASSASYGSESHTLSFGSCLNKWVMMVSRVLSGTGPSTFQLLCVSNSKSRSPVHCWTAACRSIIEFNHGWACMTFEKSLVRCIFSAVGLPATAVAALCTLCNAAYRHKHDLKCRQACVVLKTSIPTYHFTIVHRAETMHQQLHPMHRCTAACESIRKLTCLVRMPD